MNHTESGAVCRMMLLVNEKALLNIWLLSFLLVLVVCLCWAISRSSTSDDICCSNCGGFVQYVIRLCALRYKWSQLLEPEDLMVIVVNRQWYNWLTTNTTHAFLNVLLSNMGKSCDWTLMYTTSSSLTNLSPCRQSGAQKHWKGHLDACPSRCGVRRCDILWKCGRGDVCGHIGTTAGMSVYKVFCSHTQKNSHHLSALFSWREECDVACTHLLQ